MALFTHKKLIGHAAMLIACTIFGINYAVSKMLMPLFMTPYQLVIVRVVALVIILWIVGILFIRETVARTDIKRLLLLGFLNVVLNQFFFFVGLHYGAPVDTAIIHSLAPIMVFIFATLMAQEAFKPLRLIGIFLGLAGTFYLVTQSTFSNEGNNRLLGNIFIVINMTAYSLYMVLVKPLTAKYHNFTVMKWVFSFGLLLLLPFTFQDLISWDIQGMTLEAWGALAFVVIITTFFGFYLTLVALQFLSATSTIYYTYLQPIVAAIVAYFLYSTIPTYHHLIAVTFIFLGAVFINRNSALKK